MFNVHIFQCMDATIDIDIPITQAKNTSTYILRYTLDSKLPADCDCTSSWNISSRNVTSNDFNDANAMWMFDARMV